MAKPVISVENLSKRYKLGAIGTGTLSHDLNALWQTFRGKENLMPPTELNVGNGEVPKEKYLWSLKDINFSINEGDIFGVIGKNGAGKSTLLKILSKITKPTSGKIYLNGRIASLLEVGTGFHPDLTGRENVYLNGAILGMKKKEIERKFDDIVSFSGVEKFIDTPVKRYSSGMYVRLAFSVAAYLEPEILIIDEVLAVGDAEFQQKCVGKIKDISYNKGRTILFVSHNITAIKQLTNNVLVLENGIQKFIGNVNEGIRIYGAKEEDRQNGFRKNIPAGQAAYFTQWRILNSESTGRTSCYSRELSTFVFSLTVTKVLTNCELRLMIFSPEAVLINASSLDNSGSMLKLQPGEYEVQFSIVLPLKPDQYYVEPVIISIGERIDAWMSATPLSILDSFDTHTEGALLNIKTDFSLQTMGIETKQLQKD